MQISEDNLSSLKKCREIKQEILRFGVSQLEIQQLIKLLALELEDREKMLSKKNAVEEQVVNILLPEEG